MCPKKNCESLYYCVTLQKEIKETRGTKKINKAPTKEEKNKNKEIHKGYIEIRYIQADKGKERQKQQVKQTEKHKTEEIKTKKELNKRCRTTSRQEKERKKAK